MRKTPFPPQTPICRTNSPPKIAEKKFARPPNFWEHRCEMDCFLIDGFNLGFRCFYAMPDLSRSDGFPTGALHAFFQSLLRLSAMDAPHAGAVFFDKGGSARHRKIFPEYKANREETPENFRRQLPPYATSANYSGTKPHRRRASRPTTCSPAPSKS